MNMQDINARIADRSDCFYWQTDRKISVEEAAEIWKDRHSAITNDELFEKINAELIGAKLAKILPLDENAQTSLGNVNSVRIGILTDGREVIIRCHPKGVKNGYFYAESAAADLARKAGLPAYETLLIHELETPDDISYQVIEKMRGDAIKPFLIEHPEKEHDLVVEMGKTMAALHKIEVKGFGPFDNDLAKNGELRGRFGNLRDSICAGLRENTERLVSYGILDGSSIDKILALFEENPLIQIESPVLIHNDFADWNLLTDGEKISGIIDWDECVGGHPIQEIACWSTFFVPERLGAFLEGYFSVSPKTENFDELLRLFRLRYLLSKMALRTKRYNYEKTEFLKGLIEVGQSQLGELFEYYNLG